MYRLLQLEIVINKNINIYLFIVEIHIYILVSPYYDNWDIKTLIMK